MTKKFLGLGLLVAGVLLISEANAERYRHYNRHRNNVFQSRPNIFGGMDYRNGSNRVRSIPNIHGGFNFRGQTLDDSVRYRRLYYRRSFRQDFN